MRSLRFTGAVYFEVEATAPWAAEAPPARDIAPYVRPTDEHLVEFHAVVSGRCHGGIVGEPPILLEAGDVVAFPHGDAHVLSSEAGVPAASDIAAYRELGGAALPVTIHKGPAGPADARIVCGFLSCERQPFNPLLSALPRVLHARSRGRPNGAIARFLDEALAATRRGRPGDLARVTTLSELMFFEVVQHHLDSSGDRGWLAGLRDPVVGRALAKLHGEPSRAWTVATLARAVGVSRSVIAERFRATVEMPPMTYLARWRMQLAASRLRDPDAGVGEIAAGVGYASEAAFHRAFKRQMGVGPGAWRRGGPAR